jgi:hypothetical protein
MQDKVSQDINVALKSGEKPTVEALRLLKSALMNAKIAAGHDLTDDEAIAVIRKEMKSRIEARDLFSENGRLEQAHQEEFERELYSRYTPKQLSQDDIDSFIKLVISENSEANFGMVMSQVMKKCAGNADGKLVTERVKYFLEGN